MKTYTGNIEITKDNQEEWAKTLKGITKITGYMYINASTSLKADALESVGGDLYINASASLKAPKCKANLGKGHVIKSFAKRGYLFADNILSQIVSKRKQGEITVYKTSKIGNKKRIIFVVQRGEIFSHGETVKQAIHDLRYKLDGDRDTTAYKTWTLETVKPIAELIQAYRVITGSCETGTRQWCEGKKLPARVSVKVAVRLTRGAYQADKFAAFFKTK